MLLSGPAHNALLAASGTDLVGADPFPLDRPGAEALVVGVVAGEVAVLDQAAAGVPAGEVDDFELLDGKCQSGCPGSFPILPWEGKQVSGKGTKEGDGKEQEKAKGKRTRT